MNGFLGNQKMIKTVCKKCRRLNLINLNIQGVGKIQMPCRFCGKTMLFGCDNQVKFKPKEEKGVQNGK